MCAESLTAFLSFYSRGSSSTWPPGTPYSILVIFWTKLALMVSNISCSDSSFQSKSSCVKLNHYKRVMWAIINCTTFSSYLINFDVMPTVYIWNCLWTINHQSVVFIKACTFRLRHVNVYQTLQQVSEREGICLQTDGFRLWPSEERVNDSSATWLYPELTLERYCAVTDLSGMLGNQGQPWILVMLLLKKQLFSPGSLLPWNYCVCVCVCDFDK